MWKQIVRVTGCGVGAMLLALMGAGCSSDYDRTQELEMREHLRVTDWAGLKAQMSRSESEETWRNLLAASDKVRLYQAQISRLLEVTADAGVEYVRPDADEFLQSINADMLSVPAKFWQGMPLEAQRDWVKRDIVREAIDCIAAGKPASKSVRMAALLQKLKGIHKREGATVARGVSGATTVGYRQTTFALGKDRTLLVYVERSRQWDEVYVVKDDTMFLDSFVRGVVVFDASDMPVLFGVGSPLDQRENRWAMYPGVVEVKAPLADGRDLVFDSLVTGDRVRGQLVVGIKAIREPDANAQTGLVLEERGGLKREPVPFTQVSKEGKIAALNPGYGTVSGEYRGVNWERWNYAEGFLMPIYWQDQETGKVGLKAMLAQ
jgi:hypothetical protein